MVILLYDYHITSISFEQVIPITKSFQKFISYFKFWPKQQKAYEM